MLIRRHFIISKLITHQEELVAHLKHQYKIIYWDSRKTWDAFCRVVKKYEKINAWSDVVPNKKITHWADPQKYGRATPEVSACKA